MNIHQPLNGPYRERFLRKFLWSLLAISVPEVVLQSALMHLLSARALCKERNKFFEDGVELPLLTTTTNGDEQPLKHVNCPLAQRKKDKDRWKLAQGWFATMGGIGLVLREEDRKLESGQNCMTVTPKGVILLAGWDMLPDIPKSVVLARSKSSGLAKALVVSQASWMFIQTIARKFAGLPITLLELNTIAHVCCAFVMYIIWWSKPQDADELITIDVSDCVPCSEHLKREGFNRIGLAFRAEDYYSLQPGEKFSLRQTLILGSTALLYGAIHIAAWNGHFPTTAERLLWRISSCTVTGDAVIIVAILGLNIDDKIKSVSIIGGYLIFLHLFGRLYLVVEAFISVRSLPLAAYETVNWVGFLPHFG